MIHVDSVRLVTLRKTCRLCVVCEMLIAHQAEIECLLDDLRLERTEKDNYLILGTVESRTWRRGLSAGVTPNELIEHMADFKNCMRIDYTPGGWYRKDPATD